MNTFETKMTITEFEKPKKSGIEFYNKTNYPIDRISQNTGIDLRSNEDCVIESGSIKLIHTGIFISYIDHYIDFQIRSRSGLAAKNGVFVLNSPGTIDSNYRGELCVILANLGKSDFLVEKGMRIAQMTFNFRNIPEIKEVSEDIYIKSIEDTERSTGGFGSTGTK